MLDNINASAIIQTLLKRCWSVRVLDNKTFGAAGICQMCLTSHLVDSLYAYIGISCVLLVGPLIRGCHDHLLRMLTLHFHLLDLRLSLDDLCKRDKQEYTDDGASE